MEKHHEPPLPPQHPRPGYRGAGKLQDQVALISGGDSGIGRAVAVLFAREGAHVALIHLDAEEKDAQETRRAIEQEGRRALLIPGDIKASAFCRVAVETTMMELGRLDILVNNAAYQNHVDDPEELTDEQVELTFRTNVFGAFALTKAALAHLPEGGAIINCGSIEGIDGSARLLDYSATKGALHAFTRSLAKALSERGIRVNCVAPGPEVSEEIAPAFVFFASAVDSSYVSGQILATVPK
jgi:NAD(P)-dependent dehydrogenase (short-subunit alcohol dehydrogenase family)